MVRWVQLTLTVECRAGVGCGRQWNTWMNRWVQVTVECRGGWVQLATEVMVQLAEIAQGGGGGMLQLVMEWNEQWGCSWQYAIWQPVSMVGELRMEEQQSHSISEQLKLNICIT